MVEKLTKEQERKLSEYRERYISVGLNAERINKDECIKDVHDIYEHLLQKEKVPVVILDNPYFCWVAVNMFSQVRDQVMDQVSNQVRYQVSNQVRGQVWDKVSNQVSNQVRGQVWDKVMDKVRDQVRDQVSNQVRDQVMDKVSNQVMDKVMDKVRYQVSNQVMDKVSNQVSNQGLMNYVNPYLQGSFDSFIFSFYDYFASECGFEYNLKHKYCIWKNTIKYGQIYTLDNICFVSEKPIEINKNENGLHNENGAAIIYAGGQEYYYLNGVNVPKWLAITPKEEIDIEKYHQIENVEIRQEFVRKFGLEKLLNKLKHDVQDEISASNLYKQFPITNYMQHGDKIIEPEFENAIEYKNLSNRFKGRIKNINYKLLTMDVEGEMHKYLYMDNASIIGEFHIEGVSDNCSNVFDAICWRNEKQSLPCMLT